MKSAAATPEAYLESVPAERRVVVERLRALVLETVPGATEQMQYGMLGYAYEGRPFAALASQKNYVALYLMDLYTQPGLREKHAAALAKLDVGKSCIRFSHDTDLPMETFRAILAQARTAVVSSGTLAAKPKPKPKPQPPKPSKAKPRTPKSKTPSKMPKSKAPKVTKSR